MEAFITAWLVGEGIIVYRSVKQNRIPPGPGQLLLSTGVFAILGLLATSQKFRTMATVLAWGFDVAAFLNLFANPPKPTSANWPPPTLPDTVIFPGTNPDTSSPNRNLAPGPSTGTLVPPQYT